MALSGPRKPPKHSIRVLSVTLTITPLVAMLEGAMRESGAYSNAPVVWSQTRFSRFTSKELEAACPP